ncbi:MAG: Lrp/AsnC family transcriptional regulator [Acidimicrobiales bacterium]|nr:Lrp/AsnC family transcriptional regulator [Acidimicrobiales bacterium]
MPSFDLDETDKAIIRELQADGRMPFTRLGPLVGLSQSATRQRVNRLIESGVMQVVAVTDPHLVGLEVQAMICLRATGDLRAVADQLATLEPVEYVVITAGAYDLLAEVVCVDNDHLLATLNDSIRTIAGVTEAQVLTYLDLTMQTYAWGTG